MSISDGWDNEDVFAEYVQLFMIPIFVFWLLLLSSGPKPSRSQSPKKSIASKSKPDDDEADLWSPFEDDSNSAKDTPKKW